MKDQPPRSAASFDKAAPAVGRDQDIDVVNHPPHYTFADSAYEVIKVLEAWKLDYHLGNVVKYIVRSGKKTKDPLEDLKKAKWYLDRRIENLEKLNDRSSTNRS